jgi:hypothetical protein
MSIRTFYLFNNVNSRQRKRYENSGRGTEANMSTFGFVSVAYWKMAFMLLVALMKRHDCGGMRAVVFPA